MAETVNLNTFKSSQCNNYTFFLTGAGSFNSSGGTLVNAIDRGSGAIVTYDLNDLFTFKVGYLGENTEFLPAAFFYTSSNPNKGLFSATQTLTAEYRFGDRRNSKYPFNVYAIDFG